jgi:Ser/Thr protein kinase RdoA (MazF antagonist)
MTAAAVPVDPLAALSHYPLEGPVVVERHEFGFINDNWLVTDGATGKRYILRDYLRIRDAARIAFQLAFQEHLHDSAFPTAPVMRTNDGAMFVSVDGLQFSLSPFIEGREYGFASLAQAREAGARLAQFEAVAETYAGPAAEPPLLESVTWAAPVSSHVWRDSMVTDEHEERLRQLHPGPDLADELAYFSHWRRAAAQAWPAERLAALPQAWLHCDYHGRNMVFQGDTVAGLFDFDFVARGPRTYDVGRAVFNFGREYRGSLTLREEFCRAFLEGLGPLTDEERRSLPFMAVLNWVPDAAFDAARQREPGDAGAPSRLRFAVRQMRAIQAEMRRLAPQFGWGEA